MRRTTRGGVAAAAALCAVAALPGTATADPGDLPAYRTADDTEPRKGTASSADGPRLAKGGTYSDEIGPSEKKYYSVELDAKSTPWLSAVAQPKPGSKVAFAEGLTLTLEATDGTECASNDVDFGADGAARPLAVNVARVTEPDGDCQEPGVYNLSVERAAESTSDPSKWPLELRFMQEPGLKNVTSTSPPEEGDLPTGAPDLPTGEARDIKGGTGFNDAAGMDAGVWKDRLRPGETRWYRVPVDWGQQLVMSAEFGTTQTTDDTAYAGDGVRVDLYSPARGHIGGEGAMYSADEPEQVPAAAHPVTYLSRYSYGDAAANASVAGWYYVSVHAHAEVGKFAKGAVPVTLRTTLKGKPKAAPAYDGDATEAGFGVTGDDKEQAEKGQTAAQADEGDNLKLVAYAGIGAGTVLIAGLAVWTLTARRRAAAAGGAPGAPVPGAGTGPQGPGGGWGQQPPQGWG
ncbi:hypothetical protein [Streptomyces armeniacus]|nr:hypothetical protein [Streptomyces armeniacus]